MSFNSLTIEEQKEVLKKIKAFAFDVDGVLSADSVPLHPNGEPMRVINIKDGYVIQHTVKRGYPIAIITGGNTEAVRLRFENLGVQNIYMGSAYKTKDFHDFLEKNGLKASEVLYMGDDVPDIQIMKKCGFACCPADATEDVKRVAYYISDKDGGRGCVREIMEKVLRAQGKWMDDSDAFGW